MSITAVSYFPVKFKHIEGEEGLSRAQTLSSSPGTKTPNDVLRCLFSLSLFLSLYSRHDIISHHGQRNFTNWTFHSWCLYVHDGKPMFTELL